MAQQKAAKARLLTMPMVAIKTRKRTVLMDTLFVIKIRNLQKYTTYYKSSFKENAKSNRMRAQRRMGYSRGIKKTLHSSLCRCKSQSPHSAKKKKVRLIYHLTPDGCRARWRQWKWRWGWEENCKRGAPAPADTIRVSTPNTIAGGYSVKSASKNMSERTRGRTRMRTNCINRERKKRWKGDERVVCP